MSLSSTSLCHAGTASGSSRGNMRHISSVPGVFRLPGCTCVTTARLQQLQRAYQSQASNALQQQQEQHHTQAQTGEEHHINPDEWDMNYWHYQPWWLQPPLIIATGIAFVVASLVLDNEDFSKTALLAAGPVGLYWGIFLFLLPRRFKSFAVEYIETHPEAEEAAREQQQQQLLEQQQQQQQQEEEQNQEQKH